MHILNICGYTWAIGGPARIIYDHAVEQVKLGHQVTILTPVWPDDHLYPAPDGVTVVSVKRHWFAKYFPEFTLEGWKWLQENHRKFDFIHVHGPFHFAGMMPYLLRTQTPWGITIHGLLDKWALKHGFWKKKIVSELIQKRIVRKAHVIQVNNDDEVADLKGYLGYLPDSMVKIPNGMRLSDFEPMPTKGAFKSAFSIPADQRIVLFMGRLNIKKGLDILLPAFQRFVQDRNNLTLVLAGPDDGFQKECERFVENNGLSDKIRMVGMLRGDDKLKALADAEVFVLPSYSEGFSIAVLEAMTAGVPSLVSDRVGFGEQIRADKAAYLCELNPESVQRGLEAIIDSPSYAEQIAQNANSMVRRLYTIEVVAGQLLSAFQKAIDRKSA